MTFPTRRLGASGPEVTAIGIGLMGISIAYGKPMPNEQRFQFLDQLFESGERFWDTSDVYGDCEDLLGQWFDRNPGKRQQIFLATKFGIVRSGVACNDAEYIEQACAKSLSRLHTDYIDLYYCHRVDSNIPIEKTVKVMAQLVESKKIRHLGLSEVTGQTLRRAYAVHPIAAVQMEYSPFSLDIENNETRVLETCKALGVAVVAYSPLGRGFLTGQLKSRADMEEGDWRLSAPRFSEENFSKNLQLVQDLKSFAEQKGCTTGQLVLAWLMKQWNMVIPIPGTTKLHNLKENMGALSVDLSDSEAEEIRAAVSKVTVAGGRYPDHASGVLLADTVPLAD